MGSQAAAAAGSEKAVYHGPGSHTMPNPVVFDKKPAGAAQAAPAAVPKKEGSHLTNVEERHATPMFVPMDVQKGEGHDGKPVHVMDITTRGKVLNDQFAVFGKSIYRNYFLTLLCIVLTVASAAFSVYVAAVFAYLAGHFHSERLVANAWEIEWWKGKSVVYTK
jgi:hypothetical protein